MTGATRLFLATRCASLAGIVSVAVVVGGVGTDAPLATDAPATDTLWLGEAPQELLALIDSAPPEVSVVNEPAMYSRAQLEEAVAAIANSDLLEQLAIVKVDPDATLGLRVGTTRVEPFTPAELVLLTDLAGAIEVTVDYGMREPSLY